jgi:hypothetical protein
MEETYIWDGGGRSEKRIGCKNGCSSMRDWRLPKIRSPFPYGESPYGNGQGESNIRIWDSPFPNRVCFHLGINIYTIIVI